MTTHLVTCASNDMSRAAQLCYLSALTKGNIDRVFIFNAEDVRRLPCYEQNRAVFDAPRGCGYWAWKPALLHKVMETDSFVYDVKNGDVIVYADAGVEFLDNVNYIIDRMKDDIWLFGNMYEHAHWCKRDVIEAIWPLSLEDMKADSATDDDNLRFGDWWQQRGWSRFGKQVQASVIFFRVNDHTREFVREWLDRCLFEGGRLVDDSPSRTPNHPEFRENRHDQAILTTMAYRDGLQLHWWPASYNEGQFEYPRGDHPGEGYPILFNHHRGVKTGERMA